MNDLNREIAECVVKASRALELGSCARLGKAEIGVVLEEVLVSDVARHLGPLRELRYRLSNSDDALRAAVIARLETALDSMDASFVRELCLQPMLDIDPGWLAQLLNGASLHGQLGVRLAQRAFERVLGERVAPGLRTRGPLSPQELTAELPGQLTHAIVFGELIGAVEEVFPLMLDSYSVDLKRFGEIRLNVIGVHAAWLDELGRARGIIYYNHATRELWEAELCESLGFDSCQFLYLGGDESRLHEVLARKLGSRLQLNSLEASTLCDDKFQTAEILRRDGVRTPNTALLKASEGASLIRGALEKVGLSGRRSVVLQPNQGTEGIGAEVLTLDMGDEQSERAFVMRIENLWARGSEELLVRERVECLQLVDGDARRATSFRINVHWDGQCAHAESGYVQIAPAAFPDISSVGRGGSIVPRSKGILGPLGISCDELTSIRCAACAAVAAVHKSLAEANQLGLYGVDVLLERRECGPLAWVLEINARPAGLSHSDYLESGEPGVSSRLFESLMDRLSALPRPELVETKGIQPWPI